MRISSNHIFLVHPGLGQCTGATAELAFNYVADLTATKQGGMFKIVDLPYNVSKLSCDLESSGNAPAVVGIDGWTKLPDNDYKAGMNALAKIGPLAIAVSASCWGSYEKGVFDDQQCKQSTINYASTINHAVLMVGYGVDEVTGEKYYKIRNSWGTTFGENGEPQCFLLRSQLLSFHRIVLILYSFIDVSFTQVTSELSEPIKTPNSVRWILTH